MGSRRPQTNKSHRKLNSHENAQYTNALEDNVTIYHTIKGKRVSFKNINMKVAPAAWHTLRVDFVAN